LVALTGCSGRNGLDESELERFKISLMDNENIKSYLNGEIQIIQTKTSSLKGYKFYYYTVEVNVNDSFSSLSKDEKYYSMLEGINALKGEAFYFGGGDFGCGEKSICSFEGIQYKYNNDVYSMLGFDAQRKSDYLYEIVINNDDPYRPLAEDIKLSDSVDAILKESNDSKLTYSKEPSDDDKAFAWAAAIKTVKENLKSPSDADFPFSFYNEDIKEIGNNTFEVNSYVDAVNSFGAKLRVNFSVKIKKTGETSYVVEDIQLDE
jgi:hypothetical protein